MFDFHSDGTLVQSNPDVGDPNSSDSNGMGVWVMDAAAIKGKFVEVTADRSTRQFVSRGEICFSISVNGDALTGKVEELQASQSVLQSVFAQDLQLSSWPPPFHSLPHPHKCSVWC
jgi:hypothetical protein